MSRHILLLVAVVLSILGLASCGILPRTPEPTATPAAAAFTREQAIATAREDALRSAPEVGITEARIDSVEAELITLKEADRRFGGTRGPGGYAPGQNETSPGKKLAPSLSARHRPTGRPAIWLRAASI